MAASGEAAFDRRELRRALGSFVTGITVVTTIDEEGRPRGFTANSFTSVSLDPALILVCIAHTAESCPAFRRSGSFAVNILSEDQEEVSARFASRAPDKFASVSFRGGAGGAPLIEGSLAWLDCRTQQGIEVGDHVVLIGEVVDFGRSAARPLAYCHGAYHRLAVAAAAVNASTH